MRMWLAAVACASVVGSSAAAQVLEASDGARPSIGDDLSDRLPDPFFDIYRGELIEIALATEGPRPYSSEPIVLLRFRAFPFFAFGSAELDEDALRTTADLAAALTANDAIHRVVVVGHTDSIGTTEFNDELSRARALAVARALVAGGVRSDVVRAVPLGERYPVTSNLTNEGRARNRRVEVFMSASRDLADQGVPSTPRIDSYINDHSDCGMAREEDCSLEPVVPAPLLDPVGDEVGIVRMDHPIARTERVLRRSLPPPEGDRPPLPTGRERP